MGKLEMNRWKNTTKFVESYHKEYSFIFCATFVNVYISKHNRASNLDSSGTRLPMVSFGKYNAQYAEKGYIHSIREQRRARYWRTIHL